jgi:hypothetical protein
MPPTTRSRYAPAAAGTVADDKDTPATPVFERKVYILKPDWLEVLAGDDPALRNPRDGMPMATVISAAAGLDRTALTQVKRGKSSGTGTVMGALINFLESYRGLTAEQARAALFDYVTQSEADERARQVVAA